ncbi:MAG: EXS family-domain-containing protein [Piptocephalis tieghemiana]|nr:MAG: EXS family-domain-containing protein [Piptocephalis tieghemiana]
MSPPPPVPRAQDTIDSLHGQMVLDPFPVPFRILFLILLGVFGWGANLDILLRTGVNPARLLLSPGDKGIRPRKIYELAGALSCIVFAGWVLFYGTGSEAAVTLVYASVLAVLFNPLDGCCRKERFRFLRTLRRVILGGLRSPVALSDVLTADILTSYAKVFGDLAVTVCHIFFLSSSGLSSPGDVLGDLGTCANNLFSPILTALPYGFRLRQCLAEHTQAHDPSEKSRHLANAVKYASAFPVIFLSAAQHLRGGDEDEPVTDYLIPTDTLIFLWFVFVAINSIYSFWWDVKVDWALSFSASSTTPPIFSSSNSFHSSSGTREVHRRPRAPSVHDQLLRPNLHFREPMIYYAAVIFDLLLRLTWSLKLSPHLRLDQLTAGGFIMEALEILRRWVWVYFRLEREWVARGLWRDRLADVGSSMDGDELSGESSDVEDPLFSVATEADRAEEHI